MLNIKLATQNSPLLHSILFSRWRWGYGIIFLVVLTFTGLHWKSNRPIDYVQFWLPGQAFQDLKINNLYSLPERKKIREFYYQKSKNESQPLLFNSIRHRQVLYLAGTPFLYWFFSILSVGNFETDYEIYRWTSLFCFFGGIAGLCALLKIPLFITLATISSLLFFKPLLNEIASANINLYQLGIYVLWLAIPRDRQPLWAFISGLIMGLLVFLKPNLVIIPLLIVFMRYIHNQHKMMWFEMLGLICSGAIAVTLPYLAWGTRCNYWEWFQVFPTITFSRGHMNQSFLTVFFEVTQLKIFKIFAFVVLLIMGLLLWLHGNRLWGNITKNMLSLLKYDGLCLGISVSTLLLLSPLAHFHYFIHIIPILIILGSIYFSNGFSWSWIHLIYLTLIPLIFFHMPFLFRSFRSQLFICTIIIFGLTLLELIKSAPKLSLPPNETRF